MTLAIGDGFNDLLMMKHCNVSIEIYNGDRPILNYGDVIVQRDLQPVKELIKLTSGLVIRKINVIMRFVFFNSILYGMLAFLTSLTQIVKDDALLSAGGEIFILV